MQSLLQPGPQVITLGLKRLTRPVKATVLAAFAVGLLVYGFAITNIVLCTGDALTNTLFNGNLIWIGRWSSQWLSALSTDFSIPTVSTLLMITAVAMMAGVVASLLEIRSALIGIFCGATLMCHPAVGSILTYLHNADAYMIASLLATTALWLADRRPGWWWWLAAIPLLTIGVGTYQAVLSFTVALMFVRAVQRILKGYDDNHALALTAGRYTVLFVISLIIYYVMVKVSSALSGLALTDYMATSSMGQFTAQEFIQNLIGCYKDFKQTITFLSFRPNYYVNGYPNYLLTAVVIALIPVCFWLCENKTRLKGFVLLLLTALSPLLFCSIRLANPGAVQPRMTYSVAGLYLLGLVLVEYLMENWHRFSICRLLRTGLSAASWAITLCLTIAIFVWSVGINLDLYNGKKEYDHLYDRCSDYLLRAESTEGYEPGMPIYVIGAAENSARKSPVLSESKYYYAFMVHYMDVQMPFGIANEVDAAAEQLRATADFGTLPCWPDAGCASRIEDAIVIKLSN